MSELQKRTLTVSDCNKRFGKNAYEIKKIEDGVYDVGVPEATYRKIQYRAEDITEQNGNVSISISSENPVMVWGDREIISHDAEDISFDRLKEVGAILRNHDPDQIVGKPVNVWLDEASHKGRATVEFGTTDIAQQTRKEVVEDKTLRGVSIGFRVNRWIWLADEDTHYKRFTGPAWIGVETEVLEASFTPIPADASVGVNRAVEAAVQTQEEEQPKEENTVMDKTEAEKAAELERQRAEKEADTKRHEQEKLDAAKAERERVSEIYRACQKHGIDSKDAEKYIEDGLTVEQARSKVLDIVSERHKSVGSVEVTQDGRESFRNAVTDGLRLRSGIKVDKPADGARELRCRSLVDLARECLDRAGIQIPGDIRAVVETAMRGPKLNSDMLMRSPSSNNEPITTGVSDFPLILANLANKELLDGFTSQVITYEQWARVGSLNDFKEAGRLRVSESGDLEVIPENQKYPDGKFSERREPIQLATYGKRFAISRQAIINDDLSAFTTVPRAFGRAAARKPNELAVKVLLANANTSDNEALFSAAHQNLVTVTVAELGNITLAEARKIVSQAVTALYKQKQFKHADEAAVSTTHGWAPDSLVTPATPWEVFRTVLGSSANPDANLSSGVINPVGGIATHVIEPTLEDSTLAGNSSDNVYLFANPSDAPVVEVAFLQGNRMPYMEEIDQTDADGRIWKVRLDVAAAAVDWAGAVKVNVVSADS